MTFVSVPLFSEKPAHSTPADPQIRSANAPDARHGDALADAGIAVKPLSAADFQAVMDAYYQQWGMEDDGDPPLRSRALRQAACPAGGQPPCLKKLHLDAWPGRATSSSALLSVMPAA